MNCFTCHKKMSVKKENYHYIESGLDNVYLKTPVFKCSKCKEVIADIPAMNELHTLIAINLVKKTSMLTGKEIRFLRKEMDLKANELAHILGVVKQTVSRWENDKENISRYSDRLIRMIYIQILQQRCNKVFKEVLDKIKAITPSVKKIRINISPDELKDICSKTVLAAMQPA